MIALRSISQQKVTSSISVRVRFLTCLNFVFLPVPERLSNKPGSGDGGWATFCVFKPSGVLLLLTPPTRTLKCACCSAEPLECHPILASLHSSLTLAVFKALLFNTLNFTVKNMCGKFQTLAFREIPVCELAFLLTL